MNSLDQIGLRYKTDKASSHHGYLDIYEKYFSSDRNAAIRLLEIGVLGGASINLWKAYFTNPDTKVYGLDNFSEGKKPKDPSSVLRCDQTDIPSLIELSQEFGPFDYIIDDGSHRWDHPVISFKALFPHMPAGGVYIIEDLHTNYLFSYRGRSEIITTEYFKQMTDWLHQFGAAYVPRRNNTKERRETIRQSFGHVGKHISFIHFFPQLVIIGKH